MRLRDDDLMGLHFALHLEFLNDLMFDLGWEDEDVDAWGEATIEAIADDDEDDAYPDPERRLALLLSLPAWSLQMDEEITAAGLIARAIRNRGDASSFERSLMDGDELLDFATMFDRVRAYARTSAILSDDEARIGESGEDIRGLAILPTFAAFEAVWQLANGDPDDASEFARELAGAFMTGEEIEDY